MKKINMSEIKLRELYQDKQLSSYAVSKIFKCDPTVIQKRLKEYKIKIRYPKKKIEINKEKLEELYINKGLSTYKIAKIVNCKSNNTISRKLKENGIKARHIRKIPITKEELFSLYQTKKWSLSKIAKFFSCNTVTIFDRMKKYGITSRTISEASTKYPKKDFSGNLIEKAYLIGFRLGDLNVTKKHHLICVKTNTTKTEQINLLEELFDKYGKVSSKKYSKGFINFEVLLNKSFLFLLPKKDIIKSWILRSNKYFFAFLGGYADAEANFGVYSNQARFRIRTYEKNIIKQIQEKLVLMRINARYTLDSFPKKGFQNKIMWCISVNGKQDLRKLLRLLKPYIKHAKRYEDLIKAESNVIMRMEN